VSEPASIQPQQLETVEKTSPQTPGVRVNRRVLFWVLLIGLVALDQIVKAWSRHAADDYAGRTFLTLWPNVFELRLTFNEGIAFGWLQHKGIFLAPVAIAIAGGAIWYNLTHPYESRWAHASAALLAAGALGNLYDRVVLRQVTDMFYFRLIDFPVFNVADACITIAAGMLIISWIRDAVQPPVPPKNSAPAIETPEPLAE
jgi:signal peptidase II